MQSVSYRSAGFSEIDLIRPLWEQLNRHHLERSEFFRSQYETMTFGDRKAHFAILQKNGRIRLDLASGTGSGTYIGYCVSSLSHDNEGEIESLFVDPKYRSRGVGTALVRRALSWMDESGATVKRVPVGNGNEEAWGFYRKFGFFPRRTILEQIPRADEPGDPR